MNLLRRLVLLAMLLVPGIAHADALTAVIIIAEIIGSYTVAVAIVSFVITYGFTLAVIALNVYGASSARRKASEEAARARAQYNSNLIDRATTLLQPNPAWRIVYGHCIAGGDIVAMFTSNKTGTRANGDSYVKPDAYKHLVIHVATHEVEGIYDTLINGVRVGRLDTDGWVLPTALGTGKGYVTSSTALIGATSIPVASGEGTILVGDEVSFTGDSTRYTLTSAVTGPGQTFTIAAPGLLQNVTSGTDVHIGNDLAQAPSQSRTSTIPAGGSIVLTERVIDVLSVASGAGGMGDGTPYAPGVVTVSADRLTITGTPFNKVSYTVRHVDSSVRIKYHTGADSQVVDPTLKAMFPLLWTDDHRLRGMAYVVVTLDLEQQQFQGGPPQMAFEIKGRKVTDPRVDLVTRTFSKNPALIINDHLKALWGFECVDADISQSYLIAAANACDVATNFVSLDPLGATVTRNMPLYTCSGAFTSADSPEGILNDLAESMAGYAMYGGEWLVVPGTWTAPVMDLGDDNLDGQIGVIQAGAGMDTLFNGAHASYLGFGRTAPSDITPYQNATFLAADGRELWSDYTLPFTDDAVRARNIVRIFTERNRDGLIISYPAKLMAWPLRVGDRVRVTSAEYGFVNKYFRVTDWQFGTNTAVNLTLQEDGPEAYDQADATTSDPQPNTALPNPFFVKPVVGVTAQSGTSQLLVMSDGSVLTRVLVSWDALTGSYMIPGGTIEVAWQTLYSDVWHTTNVLPDEKSVYISGMDDGVRITLRVRAINSILAKSVYTFLAHTVIGKTQAPGNVTGFVSTLSADSSQVRFTWTANVEPDYKETELHLEAVWNDATPPLFVGRASDWTWTTPVVGTYDVLAKHRDTSGNVSITAAHVNRSVPAYVPPADGADGITFVLSNEAHTVASDVFGNVPSFLGADSFISAYVGGVYSTNLWTYTKTDVNLHSYFQPGVPNHVIVDAMGGTKLLIHAAETAGSVAPVDSSAGRHGIYNPGSVVTETALHAKFDRALPFDGTADSYLEVAHTPEFALTDLNFAIQGQVYVPSLLAQRQFIVGWWGPGTATTDHSWAVLVGTDGKLNFDFSSLLDVADYTITSTVSIPTGTVTEWGVSRVGNTLTLKVGTTLVNFAFDKTIRTIAGAIEDDLGTPVAYSYYTSVQYPFAVADAMRFGVPTLQGGYRIKVTADNMAVGVPTLQGGSLAAAINYLSYDGRPFPDNMAVGVPTIQSGSIVVVISYPTYDGRPFPDNMAVGVPTLQSGTIVVTIQYVNYTNALNDQMTVGVPTLQSGTLT